MKFCEQETEMCLAIPGKVVEAFDRQGMRMAKVQFGGIVREACLEYVPEAQVGDYVLVHVGFALSRIDEEEAHRTYQLLEELDQLAELNAPVVGEVGDGGGKP
jgi:hydrogenase expression/formation protein HypC